MYTDKPFQLRGGIRLVRRHYDEDESHCPGGQTLVCALNEQGDYVGDASHAALLSQRGIVPEKAKPEHSVCSIGKSTIDGKWYGWSHRACAGFGLGDRIYDDDFECSDDTPFVEHGARTIVTNADARLAASNFAESVS